MINLGNVFVDDENADRFRFQPIASPGAALPTSFKGSSGAGLWLFFLANQLGTSVQMIEQRYGYINPVKNADRILQGMPGWEPTSTAAEEPRTMAEPIPARQRPGRRRRPERSKSRP